MAAYVVCFLLLDFVFGLIGCQVEGNIPSSRTSITATSLVPLVACRRRRSRSSGAVIRWRVPIVAIFVADLR